jgi:3-deoxy-manno-octulosonate cytidylyltransferase (CMP-KDO synthetase)
VHPQTQPAARTIASASSVAPVVIGAIPARYGSTRLLGKPLALIAGRPMVEHVYRAAAAAPGLDRVVVLTDDERILRVVEEFGGVAEMTPESCSSGTDRIAWAARQWQADAVINIQGDEPLMAATAIAAVAAHLRAAPTDAIVTLAVPGSSEDLENPNAVKVVLDQRGYALYFSRAAIPYPRQQGGAPVLRHLGIYGYQKAALLRLAALPPTPLERSESLEQLRALENGIAIRVLPSDAESWGVDTAADLARVESLLATANAAR